MKFDVTYQNEHIGKVRGSSIIPFAQYCEEEGFQLEWNMEEKKVHVEPGLHSHKINIIMDKKNKETYFQAAFMKELKQSLYDTGIEVRERSTATHNDYNLNVKLSSPVFFETLEAPKVMIHYNLTPKHKILVSFLQHHLETFHIDYVCKSIKNALPQPAITLQCEIPKQYKSGQLQAFQDEVCFIFSIGICQYFSKKNNKTAVSFSPAMLSPFLKKHVEKENSNPLTKKKEDSSPLMKKEASASENKQDTSKKEINVEVFFNYTVFPSSSKEQFIATGDLHIKNTGGMELWNPLICIKVEPPHLINLGGQILPPTMADTLGVQSEEGMKGWKFMGDDWFKKAQERGEYWVGAIDQLRIVPGESTSIPHFQLTIEKPEEKETAVIQSVVYFRDKNISFPSNNAIKFSF